MENSDTDTNLRGDPMEVRTRREGTPAKESPGSPHRIQASWRPILTNNHPPEPSQADHLNRTCDGAEHGKKDSGTHPAQALTQAGAA